MSLSIACWNVNSIKSRLHVLLPWLREAAPGIVLVQETKTVDDAFPRLEIEDLGYNIAISGQKSYNGVAIFSKYPLDDIRMGLPGDESDIEARYIEAVVSTQGSAVRVASVYVPNGQAVDADKFQYKLRFLERLRAHTATLLSLDEAFVLGGDYNVAPYPIDVYDPERLDGTVCYHPLERAAMRTLLHMGLYDAFRTLHPHEQLFSWWDYRSSGFETGKGMRIDHLLLSPLAADRLVSCEIMQSLRAQEKPSDHAPVMCILNP